MIKTLTLIFGLVLLFGACKEKAPKVITPEPPAQPVMADTIPTDTIVENIEPIPEPVKPENSYFLIAASFKDQANAENFKAKLISQGFESEVIVRQSGINQDFYKVSYKGFSDKKIAFQELRKDMSSGNFSDVWLLIK